eukprot:432376_1
MTICPTAAKQYRSSREIKVENWKIALLYYGIIILVILYVIIYTIIIDKGYQITDEAIGTVSTKVKGTASTGNFYDLHNRTVYDAMDIIYPSTETNALFLTSSFVNTPSQTRNICNGNQDIDECNNTGKIDPHCDEHNHHWKSQGVLTGICGTNNRCQVQSWCPLEDDSNPIILNSIGEFTVFVKNHIRFPNFNIETSNARNYPPELGKKAGKLTFGKNLFRIDDIVSEATYNEYNTHMLAKSGAIILVEIDWNCNLDKGLDACIPEFSFERIDNDDDGISDGFNFRTVLYHNNSNTRQLKKFYGIRLTFISSGQARMFNIVALTITLGAGVAYLGIAKLVTDLGLTYLMRNNPKFREVKAITITKLERQKSLKNLTGLPGLEDIETNDTIQSETIDMTPKTLEENKEKMNKNRTLNIQIFPDVKQSVIQNPFVVRNGDNKEDSLSDILTDSDFDDITNKQVFIERVDGYINV